VTPDKVLNYITQLQSDSNIIQDLSNLEFGLLISIYKLLLKDQPDFNFEMCFDEYREFLQKTNTIIAKKVALNVIFD
jgi:hypothetical protein